MDEMKRQPKGPIVQFGSWKDLIDALDTIYTISFKDACRILRASRPWANQYIKPFVPSVFINSSQRGDASSGKVNWVRMAAMQLDRPDMTESVWFDADAFQAFIEQSIVSCTKQTKSVPLTYFMAADRIDEFVTKREDLRKEIKAAGSPIAIAKLSMEYAMLPYEFFDQKDAAVKQLLDNQVRITERTKAPATPVPLPANFMENWEAPHDLKDYGDADETIYRQLFRSGAIRIELQLQDDAGKIGTKVFYVPDPDPIHADHEDEGRLVVTEAAWQRYLQEQGE